MRNYRKVYFNLEIQIILWNLKWAEIKAFVLTSQNLRKSQDEIFTSLSKIIRTNLKSFQDSRSEIKILKFQIRKK